MCLFYLFIYTFFSETRVQVRPLDGFFTRDSSLDVKSRKDVRFGGLNDVPLNFWGKTPPKLKFWGVNRNFKPERQNFKSLIT